MTVRQEYVIFLKKYNVRLLTNLYSKKRYVKVQKTVKHLCSHLLGGVQGRSPIDGNSSILYLSLHRHRPNPKNALARFWEPGGGPPSPLGNVNGSFRTHSQFSEHRLALTYSKQIGILLSKIFLTRGVVSANLFNKNFPIWYAKLYV